MHTAQIRSSEQVEQRNIEIFRLSIFFPLFCSAGDRCYLKEFQAHAYTQFKSVERGLSGYVSYD